LILGEWSFAEDYLAPARAFKCRLFHGDVDGARAYYREAVRTDQRGEKVIDEETLQHWGRDLLGSERAREAMTVLQIRLAAYHPDKEDEAALEYVRSAAAAADDTELAWAVEMSQARRDPFPVSARALRSYAGVYDDYEISVKDDRLVWSRAGVGETWMIPLDQRTFMLEGVDSVKIEMVREGDRTVSLRIVTSAGRERAVERSTPREAARRGRR
jgi:hypothetical protein